MHKASWRVICILNGWMPFMRMAVLSLLHSIILAAHFKIFNPDILQTYTQAAVGWLTFFDPNHEFWCTFLLGNTYLLNWQATSTHFVMIKWYWKPKKKKWEELWPSKSYQDKSWTSRSRNVTSAFWLIQIWFQVL